MEPGWKPHHPYLLGQAYTTVTLYDNVSLQYMTRLDLVATEIEMSSIQQLAT